VFGGSVVLGSEPSPEEQPAVRPINVTAQPSLSNENIDGRMRI
jgi:hypothetical protein